MSESVFDFWEIDVPLTRKTVFEDIRLSEGSLVVAYRDPIVGKRVRVQTDTHLMVRYANESATFLGHGELPLLSQRSWVSRSSSWISELMSKSSGVYADVNVLHFMLVFSDASVEWIGLGFPEQIAEQNGRQQEKQEA